MRVCLYIACFLMVSCAPRIKIKKILTETEAKFQDHVGLMVYDPQSRKTLLEFNSDRYFTPASNTKIFTLMSCLQIIGDSIPSLRYVINGDSLIFWGTGDPSFLYSEVFDNNRTYNFLHKHKGPLFFSNSNFHSAQFGPGWAWDDYQYSYSPERSPLPLYGNLMTVTDSINGELKAFPPYFQNQISLSSARKPERTIERSVGDNKLTFYPGDGSAFFTRQIPFRVDGELIVNLLADTLKKEVKLLNYPIPLSTQNLYSVPSDSLYKVMMQESDNFIAEQLLLVCAGLLSDTLKTEIAIDYVKANFLFDLPDEPQWVDGSGLSRYNLFTPRSIVRLWEKIITLVPQERLFELLAIGGKSGTIKNSYQGDPPYVFGKTGTLSNNHCLSGFLVTKKKKLLIFSFMNSNYTRPGREVRDQMEVVLKELHAKY